MGDYIHEKVTVADQVLVPLAVAKVSDGDVILTYAYSQVQGGGGSLRGGRVGRPNTYKWDWGRKGGGGGRGARGGGGGGGAESSQAYASKVVSGPRLDGRSCCEHHHSCSHCCQLPAPSTLYSNLPSRPCPLTPLLVLPQVVLRVLLEAAAAGRRFRVVVVDGRPELEGRQMLRRLLQVGGGEGRGRGSAGRGARGLGDEWYGRAAALLCRCRTWRCQVMGLLRPCAVSRGL
jgi:hypothetical protein